ncbi:MAG: nucleoside hydrolase [Chitinophagales bacterium]
MKKIFGFLFLLACLTSFSQKPVPIIFDTDIAPDYDDVGAMALLHAFADQGEATILATVSCNAFETTVPTLSVLNTYFNRPGIPIGVTKSMNPNMACGQQWAQAIIKDYPHSLQSNDQAMDAVELYRKVLSSANDHSVTIVSVGFFTNLANLLNSKPDKYSYLDGKTLVTKKVKQLVSMAGRLNIGDTAGYEFNVKIDPVASKKVFREWPTPIMMSGFEIGEKIFTGIRLINNDSIQHSPVKDAFRIALTKDGNTIGRNSWDETAVWVAVKGPEPFFGIRRLNLDVMPDGKNVLIAGDKFKWLIFKETAEEIGRAIESLMMHQPKSL